MPTLLEKPPLQSRRPATPPPPVVEKESFTQEEWQVLRTDDAKAGRAVVGIMLGIFAVAAVMYGAIAVYEAFSGR